MSEMYKIEFTLNYMLVSPAHSKPSPYSCSFPSRTSIAATNLFLSPKAIPKRSDKYDYFFLRGHGNESCNLIGIDLVRFRFSYLCPRAR